MNILSRYKAAFLIPSLSKRLLNESGWEFESNERIPFHILINFFEEFSLNLSEKYSGLAVYLNDDIKATIFYDDAGNIEYVYFQVFHEVIDKLKLFFDSLSMNGMELFIP